MIDINKQDIAFGIEIAGFNALFRVVEFNVIETLSIPFSLKITIACTANSSINPAKMIDKMVDLSIHHQYEQLIADNVYNLSSVAVPVRYFNGVIESVEHLSTGNEWSMFRINVMPTLHRLSYTSDCRIFQSDSVPDIVTKIFAEQGIINFQFLLRDSHQAREYCVQYNETHLTFIQRLLAEEGIFYYFKHEQGKHLLILTDFTQGSSALTPKPIVEFHDSSGGIIKRQYINQFNWRETLRTNEFIQRDYCFKAPLYNQEHKSKLSTTPDDISVPNYTKYHYHARYKDTAQGIPFTKYRIQSERGDASQGNGNGNLPHFSAGRKFTLNNHLINSHNREYLLVSVSHNGTQPQALDNASGDDSATYSNTFTVIADVAISWHPPMWSKPVIHGSQIAHVVGPAGEEIYTDKYGRVKLHFPWDRYSQKDDKSSCWIRVSQNWAGATWGHMAIPRIGHEVVVDFLEGDPDQPLVVGRTYHANNLPPYRLPQHKTRMTIKSRTHKGRGYNELRFEDLAGAEQIYLHSQMDYDQIIENDRREWIRHNRHLRTDHDKFEEVYNNSHQTIGNDKLDRIERHRYIHVGGEFLWKVIGKVHRWIGGGLQLFVGAGRSTQIIESDETVVGKNQRTLVGNESYLNAQKIVLEAGEELTIKAPGGFIKIDQAGIFIKGNVVNVNSGGSPGTGTVPKAPQPDEPKKPTIPEDADHRGEY